MMKRHFKLPLAIFAIALTAALALAIGAAPANQARASRYYPQLPRKITSPEMALQAYFDALFFAANLTEAEMAAAGGTVGMGQEPYAAAYACWTGEWRAKHPFNEFLASWKGTAHLELLRMIPAGKGRDTRRFFVEAKSLEAVGAEPRLGIFYYYGFFEVENGPDGWAIAAGALKPESPAFKFNGHSPWLGDLQLVARQSYAGNLEAPVASPKVSKNANGTVTVRFAKPNSERIKHVVLAQREDGIWEVLEKY